MPTEPKPLNFNFSGNSVKKTKGSNKVFINIDEEKEIIREKDRTNP